MAWDSYLRCKIFENEPISSPWAAITPAGTWEEHKKKKRKENVINKINHNFSNWNKDLSIEEILWERS